MSILNGFGSMFYGNDREEGRKGYIATKWLVISYVPIIPIGSYNIINEKSNDSGWLLSSRINTKYELIEIPLNKKQVLKTYGWFWGIASIYATIYFIFLHGTQFFAPLLLLTAIIQVYNLRTYLN